MKFTNITEFFNIHFPYLFFYMNMTILKKKKKKKILFTVILSNTWKHETTSIEIAFSIEIELGSNSL